MASPPISEASEIRRRGRQRLIGAIALVAVLVVFVPMFLDSEPRPQKSQAPLAIPSKTNAPPLPEPTTARKAAPEPAKPAAEPSKAPPSASAPTMPAPPAAIAKVEATSPAPAPAATAPTQAAPRLEGFAVQVGAFRDDAKLSQARQKLVSAGVAHYTERLESSGGPLTRLRAGPFATREAAESAQSKLKRSAIDGKVVPLP